MIHERGLIGEIRTQIHQRSLKQKRAHKAGHKTKPAATLDYRTETEKGRETNRRKTKLANIKINFPVIWFNLLLFAGPFMCCQAKASFIAHLLYSRLYRIKFKTLQSIPFDRVATWKKNQVLSCRRRRRQKLRFSVCTLAVIGIAIFILRR